MLTPGRLAEGSWIDISILEDLAQQAPSKRFPRVDRHCAPSPIGVPVHCVAPFLADKLKAVLFQEGDGLAGGQGGKLRRHTVTVSVVVPTSCGIGSPRPRRASRCSSIASRMLSKAC